MALTSVAYVGDGTTRRYSFAFPYIAREHVKVSVSGQDQVKDLTWYFVSASEIEFFNAPVSDAPIVIRRVTDRTNRLVDFENGSVLTEEELDLAHKQHFYVTQELQEEFDSLLGEGLQRFSSGGALFTGNVGDIVDAVAAEVLASDLYADLQARIADIDLNAENILRLGQIEGVPVATVLVQDRQARIDGDSALQTTLDLIGAKSPDRLAFELNEATLQVNDPDNPGEKFSLAERFTQLVALYDDNSAAIQSEASARVAAIQAEQSARAAGDAANAQLITTLQTQVDGNTASVETAAESIDGLEAQYTVKVDVNGHVAGFGLASTARDGEPFSEFIVSADRFAVARPGGSSVPFIVDEGSVYIDSAFVRNLNADVITSGVIATERLAIDGQVLAVDSQGRLTVNGIPFALVTGGNRPEDSATRGVIATHIAQDDGEVTNGSPGTWLNAQFLSITLGRTTEVLLEFTAMFHRVNSSSTTFADVRCIYANTGNEIGGLTANPIYIGGTSATPFTWRTRVLLPAGTHSYALQFKPPQSNIEIGAYSRVITATEAR